MSDRAWPDARQRKDEAMSTAKSLRELARETWPDADEETMERRLMQLAKEVWEEPSDDVVVLPDGRQVLRKFLKDH